MGARKNTDTRADIVEQASKLFAEKSVDGTGLAEISEACKISKGTLYYYFPNKERLVCECAETLFEEITDAVFEWLKTVSDDMSAAEVCSRLAALFVSDRQKARLLISLVSCSSENVKKRREAAFEQWHIMLELAALRMNESFMKRFEALSKVLIPLLIGLCVISADAKQAAEYLALLLK